ncbi:hypothetical protein JJE65_08090 [Alloprevotella tannerae]|uniref:hypothetical protein n=1 Tax=Alloprevotella tannerae TaxID=76122 RepID=UPI001EDC8538|nr:hypothetical protein [Alloprevotella tannerae]MCG2649345.1 hypothetical protein [Alloprevotella tannerae]
MVAANDGLVGANNGLAGANDSLAGANNTTKHRRNRKMRQQTTRTRQGACTNASSSIKAEEEVRKNKPAAIDSLTLAATAKRYKRADRRNGRARL